MLGICRLTSYFESFCSESGFCCKLFEKYYKNTVQKEINLGKIKEEDWVLCIGGGSLPCTAIEIARQTHAKVVVLDCEPLAVRKAKALVRKLRLEKYIDVQLSVGEFSSTDDFTVVHIAKQVCPRQQVVESVLKQCNQGTRILIRNSKSFFHPLYSPLTIEAWMKHIKKRFSVDFWSETYLLVKEEGGGNEKKDPLFDRDSSRYSFDCAS